eukprot:ANDGO_01542.mRNA.1 Dolichyl pyrophosphate Glc1Man9GlcNAc2 alpha-1
MGEWRDVSFWVPLSSLFLVAATLLCSPMAFSTDLDVHLNWLSITNKLDICKWYHEERFSQWTLDYPPFFAHFEYALSLIADLSDPSMLSLVPPSTPSKSAVLFHRLSSAAGFAVYLLALVKLLQASYEFIQRRFGGSAVQPSDYRKWLLFVALFNVFHPVLIMVDLVHFQYNAWLMTLFLAALISTFKSLSEASTASDSAAPSVIMGAVLFSILVLSKHIFLYCAPAFGVAVLLSCMHREGTSTGHGVVFNSKRLVLTAAVCLAVVVGAILPFGFCGSGGGVLDFAASLHSEIRQILSRLFPFGRGLSHAYWAPNAWSFYNFAEIALRFVSGSDAPSLTRGLVGESTPFVILPNITPGFTALVSLCFMLPSVCALIRAHFATSKRVDSGIAFLHSVYYCFLTSFMWGWHVHEKAIVYTILPLSILFFCEQCMAEYVVDSAQTSVEYFQNRADSTFWSLSILSLMGSLSIFPLLWWAGAIPFRSILLIVFSLMFNIYAPQNRAKSWLSKLVSYYALAWPAFELVSVVLPFSAAGQRFPFASKMLYSIYCAVPIAVLWAQALGREYATARNRI